MKPNDFEYTAPTTLTDCVALLGRHGDDAKLLAGGQSLIPLMNLRLAAPEVVIDLNRIADLDAVQEADRRVSIGALVRHRDVAASALIAARCPLLAIAATHVGYPAIRARGTMGGTLAHADPSSEIPLAALALDAEVEALGPGGRRTIPARDFFQGLFTTALHADELIVEARFPFQDASHGWSFHEFSRKSGDFALAAAAVTVAVTDGVVERVAIAVNGAGDRPRRGFEAEASLTGATLTTETIGRAARATIVETCPGPDGSERDFRRHLVGVLTQRALTDATEQARRPT